MFYESWTSGTYYLFVATTNGTVNVNSGISFSSSTWNYLVGVYDGSKVYFYVDGVEVGDVSQTGNLQNSAKSRVGWSDYLSASFKVAGDYDEARISNIARSADWIKAEYNNQSSPQSFYTIGNQQ
jgi:hypothetical protein